LHKAAVALKIPVYIHRPTGLPKATSGDNATERAVVTDELLKIAGKLGTRPSFDTVKGTVDVVPVHDVVQAIHRSAYFSIGASLHGKNGGLVEILHHEAVLRVSVDEFAALMQEQKGLSSLPSVPILEWFGQAKKAGFSFFMAAQDLSMGTAGAELVSRR
jgi:hybrid polyketide synthase/nonribosomal peptide synthetase ACE1